MLLGLGRPLFFSDQLSAVSGQMIDERDIGRAAVASIGAAAVLALWWAIGRVWAWLFL
jgi:hypothetical protein